MDVFILLMLAFLILQLYLYLMGIEKKIAFNLNELAINKLGFYCVTNSVSDFGRVALYSSFDKFFDVKFARSRRYNSEAIGAAMFNRDSSGVDYYSYGIIINVYKIKDSCSLSFESLIKKEIDAVKWSFFEKKLGSVVMFSIDGDSAKIFISIPFFTKKLWTKIEQFIIKAYEISAGSTLGNVINK